MQVKKFEARSMKEALEMVKSQLGPDAIILSARDNNRSFGLVGEGSVEITAAVSEETLNRKKFVESRMRTQDVETFNRSSARAQKSIIDQMVTKHQERNQVPKPITSRRYIDIDDEGQLQQQQQSQQSLKNKKVERLAAAAADIAAQLSATPAPVPLKSKPVAAVAQEPVRQQVANKNHPESDEVRALKGQIADLRDLLSQFRDVPQAMLGGHPGAEYGIPYDLAAMFERLTSVGIAEEITAEILVRAQENIPALKLKNRNLVEGWVARHLLETTLVTGGQTNGKIHVFVGPAASGKTTAMVKMASHLVVNERKKVALLTTDTFKVGAADQMRMYAQILNVPFAIIRSASDWSNIMKYIGNVDAVLVDFPGFGLKDADEVKTLKDLMPPSMLNPRVHFVASATSKDGDVTELARRYSVIGFDDAIFTSLDESIQHGTIYNFMHRFKIPLHAFGIGSRVPDDYEQATRERMLDLLFKITRSMASNNNATELR